LNGIPENNSSYIVSAPGSDQFATAGVAGTSWCDVFSKGGDMESKVDNGSNEDDTRSAGVVGPVSGHG